MEAIDRFWDVSKLLTRDTNIKPEAANEFDDETRVAIKDYWLTSVKILIIGAGGLGCELLKNLAMLGIKNIDIIDLDTIDVTNLNRQFLFRKKDIGQWKSNVAAEFVRSRVPGCTITPHTKKIQNFSKEFYSQFDIFIAGLDNIEARRWLNQMIHSLVEFDENFEPVQGTQKAIIDGGTESFSGQARIIIPYKTACFDCTLNTMSNSNVFNFCTIAETPRIPEHCIAYIMLILWDKFWNSPERLAAGHQKRDYDTDSELDMQWIYEQSLARGKAKGIEGVTYNLTLGVVKNIIPAIASTNAIIAAACATETLKL
jgi:ubiquitin-activating enzyme E1 C